MANAPFTSVQGERFHEDVGWQIARRIVRGDFSPSAPLPAEAVLIRQFGVSRAVVREALRSLEQRGLVTMRQGRRTVIAARDDWDVLDPLVLAAFREEGQILPLVRDFLWIRHLLEPEIAAEAARRKDEQLVRELSQSLQRMEVLLDTPEAFFEEDMAFHNRLTRATGNRLLQRIMTTVGHLFNMSRDLVQDHAAAPQGALGWHRQIYGAIAAGDPQRARTAMAGHLEWTAERITRTLGPVTQRERNEITR